MSFFLSVVAGQGGAILPAAPGTLSLSGTAADTIALSWSAGDAGGGTISGYAIKRDGGVIVADTGSSGTTYSAGGLTASTAYNFNVAAINEVGTGPYGNTPSHTTGQLRFGYAFGGAAASTSTTVDKFTFPSFTRSTLGTGLSVTNAYTSGHANSGVAGYCQGGSGANTMSNKFVFSTDSRSNIAWLNPRGYGNAGCANSGTAGYVGGGFDNPTRFDSASKITYSTDAVSNIASVLVTGTNNLGAFANSGTAGYWSGGWTGSAASATNKLTFSTDTSAASTALAAGRYGCFGMANSGTAGYLAGGYDGSSFVATVDKWLFATDARSTTTAMSVARTYGMGFADSGTAGYFGSGQSGGGSYQPSIDKYAFPSDTRSAAASSMSTSIEGASGCANTAGL